MYKFNVVYMGEGGQDTMTWQMPPSEGTCMIELLAPGKTTVLKVRHQHYLRFLLLLKPFPGPVLVSITFQFSYFIFTFNQLII